MGPVILLAIATAIVFYILVGYPLILAFLSRRTAPAVKKDPQYRPTVSVILAVHNGEQFIRQKLESILALDYPLELMEILVVSDGSTDSTERIVESFSDRRVLLLRAPRGGKPAALNLALRHATGDILFLTDVRQLLQRDALSLLIANLADSTVGAVTGEPRFLNPDNSGEEADMELYWRYELWVRRRHSQIDSAYNTTGWVYALRRNLAEPIPPDTLTDDAVIPLKVFLRGYRVVVEPRALAFDYPRIEGGEFRRKLRTLAGLWQTYARLPELLSGRNRMRFHFLSHKFSRLVLPWAILLAWAATIALPDSGFRSFLLTDELTLLAIAALDPVLPKRSPLRRISSPARTFLTMSAAAVLSMLVFVVPPNSLWRPTRVKTPQENTSSAR
jgi:cellulose synthase/poly-beta-1,6-N-acetylglucosamine synthase-like glycosyltransferase